MENHPPIFFRPYHAAFLADGINISQSWTACKHHHFCPAGLAEFQSDKVGLKVIFPEPLDVQHIFFHVKFFRNQAVRGPAHGGETRKIFEQVCRQGTQAGVGIFWAQDAAHAVFDHFGHARYVGANSGRATMAADWACASCRFA